jgi:hypothetical protein
MKTNERPPLLPQMLTVRVGRRKLVRIGSLEKRIAANELGPVRRATLHGEPGTDSVCAREEDFHA